MYLICWSFFHKRRLNFINCLALSVGMTFCPPLHKGAWLGYLYILNHPWISAKNATWHSFQCCWVWLARYFVEDFGFYIHQGYFLYFFLLFLRAFLWVAFPVCYELVWLSCQSVLSVVVFLMESPAFFLSSSLHSFPAGFQSIDEWPSKARRWNKQNTKAKRLNRLSIQC